MNRTDLEEAVAAAVDAAPNNGNKWGALYALSASVGLRGGGAISNQHAEQRTRIRQLLTKREVAGAPRYFQFGVFVIDKEQSARHVANPDKSLQSIVGMFAAERPELAPDQCLECVLILRHDGSHVFTPLALLSWGQVAMTQRMRTWYPGAPFIDLSGQLATAPASAAQSAQAPSQSATTSVPTASKPGENLIFFGPPGTGKSFRIKEETAEFFDVIMTAFHPDYSYSDFVGAYKPVCGADPSSTIRDFAGARDIDRPIVYYAFEPGVLTRAIVRAHEAAGAPVALVIDELNRGDCAAIFGDTMHLLDRAENGRSEYGLDVTVSLSAFLVDAGVLETPGEKLFLPANLHIFATINTSDQALYPIDSAFKRRWNWEAVPVTGSAELAGVVMAAGELGSELSWLEFVDRLNEIILRHTENEDKRIGPWFIKAIDGRIPAAHVRNKLLYFLWHDVFRGHTSEVFMPELRTFEAVQATFDKKGIQGVLVGFAELTGSNALGDKEPAINVGPVAQTTAEP